MQVVRTQRVLLVISSQEFGGAELHSVVLAEALQARGLEVILVCDPALLDRLQQASSLSALRWRDAPVGWLARAAIGAARATQAAALAPLLAELRPDTVLLPLPWPNHGLGVMEAVAAAGLPLMVISHLAPGQPVPGIDDAARQVAARLRLAWVAVSDPVARRIEQLFGMPRGRVRTVLNGVEVPPVPTTAALARSREQLREALAVPPGTPVGLFAGRLAEAKGADLLPEVARRFHAACGGVLACAGEGPLQARIAGAAGQGFRLLGYRDDIAQLLIASDALLLPSRLEGCPLIYLEAAVRHRPVVASWAALECFGDAAAERAVMVAGNNAASLAAGLAHAVRPPQVAEIVAEAWRYSAAHDRAVMLAAHLGILRGLSAF